jgi:hypothetical protein
MSSIYRSILHRFTYIHSNWCCIKYINNVKNITYIEDTSIDVAINEYKILIAIKSKFDKLITCVPYLTPDTSGMKKMLLTAAAHIVEMYANQYVEYILAYTNVNHVFE